MRRSCCSWLLTVLILCLVTRSSWGQTQPGIDLATEADLHFELGIQRYRAQDYRGALEHLLHSNRLGPNKNVIFNIARCFQLLGEYAQAYRYYAEYLEIEDEPRARRQVEATIAQMRPHLALVRIESNPPGATIYIDRRDLGARGHTPLTLALRPGSHRLFLDLEGYESLEEFEVEAVRGRLRTVQRDMVRIVGHVEVNGDPEGAEIRLGSLDGEVIGRVPATIDLPLGPQVLVISAAGRETVERVILVRPRESHSLSIDLPQLVGSLVVTCSDRGARVEIDGEYVGRTTEDGLTVPEVAAGDHQLRVFLSGFETHEQEFSITVSQPTNVDVQLRIRREVIAASRSPETLDEAPTSVTIVSREEIRAFGYRTLAEAMAGVRGMSTNYDHSYYTIGFRGFNLPSTWGNRALVTIDGHTTNEDETGGFGAGMDQRLDLMNLERIEVVRGPASALYGTNALVGVINMVSRGLDDLPRPYFSLTGDSTRMIGVGIGGGYRFTPRAGMWMSSQGYLTQGQDILFPEFVSDTSDGVARDVDSRTAANVVGIGWLGDFTLQVQYVWRRKLYPTAAYETIFNDNRALLQDQRGFVELRWEPEFNRIFSLMARLYLDWYNTETGYPYEVDEGGLYEEFYDSVWMGGEVRGTVRLPFWQMRLALGAEARGHLLANLYTETEEPSVQLDYETLFQVIATYLQVRASPTSWFSFSLSGRFEYFNLPDFPITSLYAVSPHLALIFRASPRDIIKLIGATAFRAPTPTEFFTHDYGDSMYQADELQPERIYSAELEYTHRFTEELSLTGAAFYNIYDDLIDMTLENVAREVYQYNNTEENVHTIGGELELQRIWRQGWMISASYSFQRTRYEGNPFRDKDEDGESTRLSNSPEHMIALGGAVPLIPTFLTLASRVRVESPRYTLDLSEDTKTSWVVLWDVVLSGEVPRAHLSYNLGLRNLLDWQYNYPVGPDLTMLTVQQQGRSVFASLILRW